MQKPWQVLQKWCERRCTGPDAMRVFVICTFAGSSFFPVPSDVLLPPMLLGHPANWRRILLFAILSSLAGSVAACFSGLWLFDWVNSFLSVDFVNDVRELEGDFKNTSILSMFIVSALPLPSKLFALAAGVFAMPFGYFFLAVLIGRVIRFYVITKMVLGINRRTSRPQ